MAGWPVAHSRSPAIQNAALAATGLSGWRYQLLPIPPELFEETVAALPEAGFRGINVTIPHKERALALALTAGAAVSGRARAIGAANTLVFDDGALIAADNTDAPAFAAALRAALGGGLSGISAVVLGAGGSARAAVWALLDAGAAEVRVWNRTAARARELCESIARPVLHAVTEAGPADVLVNCTSVGLGPRGEQAAAGGGGQLPVGPELPYRVLVDFVYRDGGTLLVRMARAGGIATVDGLELLVGQGALSFEQFTGRTAPLEAMRAAAGLSCAR